VTATQKCRLATVISDLQAFKTDHRHWRLDYGIEDVLRDIYEHNAERRTAIAP
jgi:hypothetical protein